MNELQQLIKLKGTTVSQIAREVKVGYHGLQKTVNGVRKTPSMRKAIAKYFRVDPKLLFGLKSHDTINYLMEQEIGRRAEDLREELRKKYLKQVA